MCTSGRVWAFEQLFLSLPHTYTEMCWRSEVRGSKPYFHTYITINDHSMNPDWIFIMWPNPTLCWSLVHVFSPSGPQSRQPALSLGASYPSGTYPIHPWASLPTPAHANSTYAHVLPLWLICSLQLWAHSIVVQPMNIQIQLSMCNILELKVIYILVTVCLFIICDHLTPIERWNKQIID